MFGTSGVRGPVGDVLTAGLALDIGRALATDGAESVVLGRDAHDSGRMLGRALTAGLIECGAAVVDVGDKLRWRVTEDGTLSVEPGKQHYDAFSELTPIDIDESTNAADDHDRIAGDF